MADAALHGRRQAQTQRLADHTHWLFRRLQRLDTEGYAIQNLADPKTNPFIICSQDLFSIASEFLGGFAAWTIPSFLSWYFDGVDGALG